MSAIFSLTLPVTCRLGSGNMTIKSQSLCARVGWANGAQALCHHRATCSDSFGFESRVESEITPQKLAIQRCEKQTQPG